jgi:hypothetical protein
VNTVRKRAAVPGAAVIVGGIDQGPCICVSQWCCHGNISARDRARCQKPDKVDSGKSPGFGQSLASQIIQAITIKNIDPMTVAMIVALRFASFYFSRQDKLLDVDAPELSSPIGDCE